MRFAVVSFPGSNCDDDVVHVLRRVLGASARLLVKLTPPGQLHRIVAIRPGFFLAADDPNAQILVRHLEGR